MSFDPGGASSPDSGIFGLPHGPEEALVHVLGVPFEATTTFRTGTALGPAAVLDASRQIDLFDLLFGRPYEAGIWMAPIDGEIQSWSHRARALAAPLIEQGGAGPADAEAVRTVDGFGDQVNGRVREFVAGALEAGKLPALLGGDHSTPFGAIAAAAERHQGLGILQFDAHADLRPAFEGFRWSHASIMHNVLAECPGVAKLVQVGIRDLCEQEFDAAEGDARVHAVYDTTLAEARRAGQMRDLVRATLAELPDEIYISFDIDALDPSLCPHTGTPVPGGLAWDDTMLWLEELAKSGKRVVALDLNEVAGDEWDAIVGSRMLYRLIGCALASR